VENWIILATWHLPGPCRNFIAWYLSSLLYPTLVVGSTESDHYYIRERRAGYVIIMASALHLTNKEAVGVEFTETGETSSPNGQPKVFDDSISRVPEKYRGTALDRRDMTVMGKKQVLRVRHPSKASIAFAMFLTARREILDLLPCLDLLRLV
jgi:hypothetical protein